MRNDMGKSRGGGGSAIAKIAVGAVLLKVLGRLGKWALVGGALAGAAWLVRRLVADARTDDEVLEVQYAPRAAGISLAP
jgi:hypothetical protein